MRTIVTVVVVVALVVSLPSTAQAGPILESALARAARAAMTMQPMGRASLGRNRMKVAVGLAVLAAGATLALTTKSTCAYSDKALADPCYKYDVKDFVGGGLIHTYGDYRLYVPNGKGSVTEPVWLINDYEKVLYEPGLMRRSWLQMGTGLAVAAAGAYLIGWWAQPEERLLSLSVGPGAVGVQRRIGF